MKLAAWDLAHALIPQELDTSDDPVSQNALQTRHELLQAHSSVPAVVRPVNCTRFIIDMWLVFISGFLVAAAGITVGTIACSNGVFLVIIAGAVQAFAAWTLLVHVGRIQVTPPLPTLPCFTSWPVLQVGWVVLVRLLEPLIAIPIFCLLELAVMVCLIGISIWNWPRYALQCVTSDEADRDTARKGSNRQEEGNRPKGHTCVSIGSPEAQASLDTSLREALNVQSSLAARAFAIAGATAGLLEATAKTNKKEPGKPGIHVLEEKLDVTYLSEARKVERGLIRAAFKVRFNKATLCFSRLQAADKTARLESKLEELQVRCRWH